MILIDVNLKVRRSYRLFVIIFTLIYSIYCVSTGSWRMLIVPIGQVPLILMWILTGAHFIGMFLFVWNCCRSKKLENDLEILPNASSRANFGTFFQVEK